MHIACKHALLFSFFPLTICFNCYIIYLCIASKNLLEVEIMKKQNRFSSFWNKVVEKIQVRIPAWVIVGVFLAFALACVFMFDPENELREAHFAFLETNVFSMLFDAFNLTRMNVQAPVWPMFMFVLAESIFAAAALFFIPRFVQKHMDKNGDLFETEQSGRKFYNSIYWAVSLALMMGFFMLCMYLGVFEGLKENPGAYLINLLFTLLLFLAFFAGIPAFFVVMFLFFRLLLRLIGLMLSEILRFVTGRAKGKNEGAAEVIEIAAAAGPKAATPEEDKKIPEGADLFPALTAIDLENAENPKQPTVPTDINLDALAKRFQAFAANRHKIYYGLPLIRSFLAGLATSRLVILEGMSGTGKTMLPRMFSAFTGCKVNFFPIQPTWRDKTDVLGFFNEFTKTFKMTEFLSKLYAASYTDKPTFMVMDEMNLSRIEYYFADFLSVLEFPKEEWRIQAHSPELNQKLPAKLDGGYITVPPNTWFIGTANTDDSTFTITDKVYDRAISLDFNERHSPFSSDYESAPIEMSSDRLQELFAAAKEVEENRLSKEETDKFLIICDFVKDTFDVSFGNRIMTQINAFVPVYVAAGGSKEDALDFLFSTKVMRKLNGAYEDYVKDGLIALTKLIEHVYGKDSFRLTNYWITKTLRKFV